MLPVSADYQNAILASTRRIRGKARISYSDPFLDPSVDTEVNEAARISWENQVVTISIDQETEESAISQKYASLDGTWVLDGTWHLAPDTAAAAKLNHFGWWGKQLSGVDGVFISPYPALTARFSARTVILLAVQGDNKRGEWPVDFNIQAYDANDILVHTEAVVGNTDINWQKDISPVDGVVKLMLEITKWSHEGQQVKIAGFFSVLIENYTDELMEISLTEEREFSTGSLPIGNISSNEITLRISNADHRFDAGNTESQLYNLVKMNRKIKAWLGVELASGIEYLPLGTFYAKSWSVPENAIDVSVVGRDRLELLTMDKFNTAILENVSLYSLAETILNDVGVVSRFIDTELQNYVIPYAYFGEKVTHRECLRLIAEASLSQVYMDRNSILRIEGPSYSSIYRPTPVSEITRDDYFNKDNPYNETDLANYIEVTTQPLVSADLDEVYNSSAAETIGIGETKQISVSYSKKPCIEASASLIEVDEDTPLPPGVVIIDAVYYATTAILTIGGATASGTFKIQIMGKPLTVTGAETITKSDPASIREHGTKSYTIDKNPLVQTSEMARAIAVKCLALSKDSRRDLTLEWRGNPALELGDKITVPDSKTTTANFYITSQEISYDGGLRVVTKGKKVAE